MPAVTPRGQRQASGVVDDARIDLIKRRTAGKEGRNKSQAETELELSTGRNLCKQQGVAKFGDESQTRGVKSAKWE